MELNEKTKTLLRVLYRESRVAERGLIYVIRNGSDGPVRIGFAKHNPQKRMEGLQIGNPVTLLLCMTIPGTLKLEQAIHRVLRGKRIRGEWFDWTPATRMVVEWMATEPGFKKHEAFELLQIRYSRLEN